MGWIAHLCDGLIHGHRPHIRDPYVLEFTGLADCPAYSENELETALLNHVQGFLLELGTGFCFEARQFRITVGNEHDRIDLVFYHRRQSSPHAEIFLPGREFRPRADGRGYTSGRIIFSGGRRRSR